MNQPTSRFLLVLMAVVVAIALVAPGARAATVANGTLVRAKGDNKIYVVYNGTKQWIESLDIFTAYKLSWNKVKVLAGAAVSNLPEGPAVNSYLRGSLLLALSSGKDVTKPSVDFSPSSGTLSGTTTIAISASDNVGIDHVEFFIGNDLKGSDGTAPYTWSLNTAAYADGVYSVRVRAYDTAGNASDVAHSITFRNTTTATPVPTAAPTPVPTPVSTPIPAGGKDTTRPSVDFTPSSGTVSGLVAIHATASDNVAVGWIDFYVDGAIRLYGAQPTDTFTINTSDYGRGTHTIMARAYDRSGNAADASHVLTFAASTTGGSTQNVPPTPTPVSATPTPTPVATPAPTATPVMTPIPTAVATPAPTIAPTAPNPRVTFFDVQPRIGATNVTATFSATDTVPLATGYLNRAPYNASTCSDTVKTGCAWMIVGSLLGNGSTTWGASFTDVAAAGTYWYGMKLVDVSGVLTYEPTSVKVSFGSTATPAPSTPAPTAAPTPVPTAAPTPTPGTNSGTPGPSSTNAPLPYVTPISGRTYDPNEALVTPRGTGTVYYVDGTNGSDSNSGTSLATAFKTIGKALSNRYSSVPASGDTILIRKGIYYESPNIDRKPGITIGAYGDGEVIVDVSTRVSGWTQYSGSIYKAPVSFTPAQVVVNNIALFKEPSLAALQAQPVNTSTYAGVSNTVSADTRWYYDGAGSLYVWAPGGVNPANADVGVVSNNVGQHGFTINESNNVTVYGITERFSGGHGFYVLGDNTRLDHVKALFNEYAGINFYGGYSGVQNTNQTVIKSYVYMNVMENWPRTNEWGGWHPGIVSNGGDHLTFQGNVAIRNGGEGILIYGGAGSNVFRDNIAVDNYSVNIYADNHPNDVIDHNFSVCHNPDFRDTYSSGNNLADGRILRRLRPIGIDASDDTGGTGAKLANTTITNNVIVNCRYGFNHDVEPAYQATSGLKNLTFANNTIVVPSAAGYDEQFVGMQIPYDANDTGTVFRNNIVYVAGGTGIAVNIFQSTNGPVGTKLAGITFDHNLYYPAGNTATTGSGDVIGNPMLANINGFAPSDFRPQSGSPAIGAGASVPGVSTDFTYASRPQGAWDIGAFEQ